MSLIAGLMCAEHQHRLGARRFAAKIEKDNDASLALFRKLGFVEESFSAAFQQHCLVLTPSPAMVRDKHRPPRTRVTC